VLWLRFGWWPVRRLAGRDSEGPRRVLQSRNPLAYDRVRLISLNYSLEIDRLFMLAVTGGKERTLEQHRDLLASADFRLRRAIPVSDELMIFEATPV
jgi:hypothetical protein